MSTNESTKTKVITGLVRLSYAHLFTPEAAQGATEKKYSVSLIIKKSDKETIAMVKAAIREATEEGKSKFWNGKLPKKALKVPLRDGDEDRDEDVNYAGCFFINASSKTKPGVVDIYRKAITDEEQVYSGCYARVSVNFYPYDTAGNSGIACGLNNVMKIKDGEFLGGRASADSDFADINPEDYADDDFDPLS